MMTKEIPVQEFLFPLEGHPTLPVLPNPDIDIEEINRQFSELTLQAAREINDFLSQHIDLRIVKEETQLGADETGFCTFSCRCTRKCSGLIELWISEKYDHQGFPDITHAAIKLRKVWGKRNPPERKEYVMIADGINGVAVDYTRKLPHVVSPPQPRPIASNTGLLDIPSKIVETVKECCTFRYS